MEAIEPFWNWAIREFPRYTMSKNGATSPVRIESTITRNFKTPSPKPTAIGFLHFGPEANSKRYPAVWSWYPFIGTRTPNRRGH